MYNVEFPFGKNCAIDVIYLFQQMGTYSLVQYKYKQMSFQIFNLSKYTFFLISLDSYANLDCDFYSLSYSLVSF